MSEPRVVDKALESMFGAETRRGEAETAVLLTLNVFLLLLAYYLLKVAREPLILIGGGAEVKSYAAAGQAVLTIFVAFGYGALARRFDRVRLISVVMAFFVSNLLIFALLESRGVAIGVPFYLWVGVFNMAAIAQFWAFAADIYDEERGKRMFPILGIGSSIGAVAGSRVARLVLPLGPAALMLLAAGILALCIVITVVVDRIERRIHPRTAAVSAAPIGGGDNGFTLLLRDRYLMLLGAFMIIYNWVNTTGEYVLDRTLLAADHPGISAQQFIGSFKADFFLWVNGVGVVLQVLVVSRVIRYLGVRVALFVMPMVSLASYSTLALAPILSFVFVAKVAENSLDYSLQNTTRHALWLITSR
jgi:AAA family ATP:ADP antiporter